MPSLPQQVQEYNTRALLARQASKSVKPVDEVSVAPVIDVAAAVDRILQLAGSRDAANLEAAVKTLLSTAPIATNAGAAADGIPLPTLWNASATLCRACQESGRMDLAQDVLQLAVKCGQLDAAVYFAHNPLPVVESLIPLDELRATAGDTTPLSKDSAAERRHAFVKRLQDAMALFLPPFATPSQSPETQSTAELTAVGMQLLECAFAAHHLRSIKAIYASVMESVSGDFSDFSHWYISQLQQAGYCKLAVSTFVQHPPNAGTLSERAFFDLGDRAVEAVREAHFFRADEVLLALQQSCNSPAGFLMRTSWVTDLLYGQWRKTRKYDEVKTLFAKLGKSDDKNTASASNALSSTVYHVDGAYRVMIQIALEASKEAEAKSLFAELSSIKPSVAGDIRLLGLFALAKAKACNWAGVKDDFRTAAAAAGSTGLPPRDAERVFVPIVKEYIQSHTIGETEDFLKLFIDEMGVPVGRYLVTLLANEYGALREVRSFVGWLEYCARTGFPIDSAFSNAILQNCRRHWKFSFRDLRTLYRKLRMLSPNFEDKVTQTIMTYAAISDAKHIGRPVKGRVLSLRLKPALSTETTSTPATGLKTQPGSYISPLSATVGWNSAGRQPADENDLYLSMKQAFASGYPAKVVRMYKHAMRGGMPPSSKCLKLAVSAAVRRGKLQKQQQDDVFSPSGSPAPPATSPKTNDEFDGAIELLKAAHATGHDIDGATAYLAIAYIDALRPRSLGVQADKTSVATAVKTVLCRLNACDVQMSDLALNRAAFHMFKAGHMRGAITLALSAANSPVGGGKLGYNVWNFSVLVSSYARLANANGIRLATQGAAANGVLGELMGYKVLKQARRGLRTRAIECEIAQNTELQVDAQSALLAVEEALDQARAARQKLGAERRELEAAAIDIMRRAALDAGNEPVDFDQAPYLRRREPRQETAAAEDGSSSISSGSTWDLLDMPVDQDGKLVDTKAMPAMSVAL